MLKITQLIASTKAALASATDPKKKTALVASLAAYEATLAAVSPGAKVVHKIEHKETHTADSDADDKEKEAVPPPAKGDEDEPDGDEDGDEEAASEGDEDEPEAAAGDVLRAAVAALPVGERTKAKAQLAALAGKASMFDRHGARLAKLEADATAREKKAVVASALAARKITPGEARTLRAKSPSFVREFIEMRPHAIVHGSSDDLATEPSADGVTAQLGDALEKMIAQAVASSDGKITREQFLADYRKQNGANGAGSY